MKSLKVLSALGLLAVAGAANAEVSANASAVSQYMWRGQPQTAGAALQGGIDYSSDSGFYVGTWGSNVDWSAGGAEVDVYGGWSKDLESGLGLDFGATMYAYPNDSGWNTVELSAKASISVFSFGLYYTSDYFDSDAAMYVSGDASIPLGETPLSLDGHVGYSSGDGITQTFGVDNYVDYSAGVTYSKDAYTFGMHYISASDIGTGDAMVASFGVGF